MTLSSLKPVPIFATICAPARFPINNDKSSGIFAAKHNETIARNVSPAPTLSTILSAKAGQLIYSLL